MLSIPDMALLGAAALLLFGPDQLPRVARKAGLVMRDIQNTSQTFIREMERAADLHEPPPPAPVPFEEPPAPEPFTGEQLAEPRPAIAEEELAAERHDADLQAADPPEPLEPAKPAPESDHPTHV